MSTTPLPTHKSPKCDYASEQKVNVCLQPMLKFAAQLQSDTGMQLPVQGRHVFAQLCTIYKEFKSCVKDLECDSLSEDAVDASYGYMCGSGQALFEQHAACFAQVEVEKEYISCKIAATQAIAEAQKSKSKSTEAYLSEMCRAMDGYLRCSHPIILAHCGPEAWKLVSTVTADSLGVTMPDCDMHSALL
ncbi:unnamed protein product, partial [Mesorhabditis belari]|uniref:DUF19 domain-containing protein n=1 Tax=Mesorhabditis belari TaxID=2138241 RepID=A0AAF3EAW0_9BILA